MGCQGWQRVEGLARPLSFTPAVPAQTLVDLPNALPVSRAAPMVRLVARA